MRETPVGSFVQSVFGFLLFISVSLGITYLVNSYATERAQAQAEAAFQAAALQALLGGLEK
jgi:hypothetical protein